MALKNTLEVSIPGIGSVDMRLTDDQLKNLVQAGAARIEQQLDSGDAPSITRGPTDPHATTPGGFVGHVSEIDFGHNLPSGADIKATIAAAKKFEDNFAIAMKALVGLVAAGLAAKGLGGSAGAPGSGGAGGTGGGISITDVAGKFFQLYGR